MELATRNQWSLAMQQAANDAVKRDHLTRLREALGQSYTQAREKAGALATDVTERTKANWESGEVKRQAMRSGAAMGTALAFGMARGAFGDERLNVGGMPIELIFALGAHLAGGTVLAGTPGALLAHGAGDALLGASVAQIGRGLGQRGRAYYERSRAQRAAASEAAAAGYAPYGEPEALPPGYAPALPVYAGAAPNAADRAMAEAIEIMRASGPVPRAA